MEHISEERKLRAKKRRRTRRIVSTVMVIMLLSMTVCCLVLLFAYTKEKENAKTAWMEKSYLEEELGSGKYITKEEADAMVQQTQSFSSNEGDERLEQIKTMMESGENTLTMLETTFPDQIVVPDTGRYCFFDISETIEKHDYKQENFIYPKENEETGKYEGEAYYTENEEVTSKKGIDVSKFQGNINWKKVATDGVEFAFIRLGYRGYGSGKIVLDEEYEDNIEGCNNAGIDAGVYFFTEALNEKEAVEEAEFVLENIKGYKVKMPIVIDVEESASKDSRTKDLTKEQRTANVIAFCERIKKAGHEPMIYGNLKSFMIMMDIEQLEEYDKWFAYYRYPLRFPYKFRIWQYTASGKVSGIKGDSDLNIMFY